MGVFAIDLPVLIQQGAISGVRLITPPLQEGLGGVIEGNLLIFVFVGDVDETDDAQAVEPVKEMFAESFRAVAVVVDSAQLTVEVDERKKIPKNRIQTV